MDVGTNKTRKDTRAVVSLVARYRSPNTFEYVEEACCDVSLGGMFIRSKDPAAAGTLLKLECESGVGEQIRGVARVVWLRGQHSEYGPSGMGVKFVKLDPESRDLITRLVQELAEAGIQAPSMSSAPENRGKPAVKRSESSMPAEASSAEPPPPPTTAVVSATPSASQAPTPAAVSISPAPDTSERAAAQAARAPSPPPPAPRGSQPPRVSGLPSAPRASQPARVSSLPPVPPPMSSRPSPPPPMSSRPAPSGALLAHGSVDALDIDDEPSPSADASTNEGGRDLAPLQAMVRGARVSSVPPPSDHERSRAFWLVAGAVVALGAIVALFSLRTAREAPSEAAANAAASPATQQAPAPAPTSMNQATPEPEPEPEPAQPSATAQPTAADPGAETAAQADLPSEEPSAELAQVTPAEAPATPNDATQVAVPAPTAPTANAQAVPDSVATGVAKGAAAAVPANTPPSNPQPSAAPSTPPPSAAVPATPEVPVLRIVPADPAPAKLEAAQQQAPAQPVAANPTTAAAPPSAATPSSGSQLSPAPAQPAASKEPAATSSTTPAANAKPASSSVAPPPLAPGETAHIVTFTSRPMGATIFVGDRSVVTPAELDLGAMPTKIRVTAEKAGFESSTVWVNNVAEFVKVGRALRREVHFVMKALPAAAPPAPGQP